ncbi:Molybdopterin adenylyltransferase [Candidatus Promineifilum breve]|uniref:Molybdopterin adenylyltransferase n=1 Tax=Candidatus Promineifilum breve TaxID=1806508 RepID=A0A160T3R7_9CHLR|nr:MogA/MoaB family molybdenum cofactor biosynthesis protein [Candidatus Promineifilum breve]CUS04686.2 Molybdopterin adenylyltransferase [Candidatus Promineifilum breve]
MRRVGILTVSDRAAAGTYADESGPLAAAILGEQTAWRVERQAVIPDDLETIARTLRDWCEANLDLILTTGGTGFAPRDVTPEATRAVIERDAPGIAEALRAESLKVTRHAMLSRAVAGLRGGTLIINLPGNPKAVGENLAVLLPVLPHALDLLTGRPDSGQVHRDV